MTGINRRQFSLLLAGALTAPNLLAQPPVAGPADDKSWLLASAASDSRQQHWLIVSDTQGALRLRHRLLARAHHVAAHPSQPWVAVVAKRPGAFIDVLDYRSQALVQRIEPAPGRLFYGHALFSRDGRWLIATESTVPDGAGRISLRDAQNGFQPVTEFSSGGTGPHELLLNHAGDEIIVANGGIRTQGRLKLNLDSMQPSLAYLKLATGEISEQRMLPPEQHQLSIRHLDLSPDGAVVMAMQYEGDPLDTQPLVALHRRGQELQALSAPEAINRQMTQYCGSVRIDSSGKIAAISAPRGGLITFWDIDQAAYLSSLEVRDGCGLAATATPGEFIASSGNGRVYWLYPREGVREPLMQDMRLDRLAWDNHLCAFQAV
ncbi:hypothetical protein A8C75_00145 [Marinobacterium aestuarii]|uniref:Twin-arginine translocation pathway signal n=1 Tax=Marinobacterium aestuarii TaxID=1821621 RepID=A0A1A9ETX3_9GAMM|nr:DUF1513 domain-containing protein [Marinobacterium aestuarii]ANG61019.1 hypothetical protein A8C75_00145 [Marinobacterium aestuarii]